MSDILRNPADYAILRERAQRALDAINMLKVMQLGPEGTEIVASMRRGALAMLGAAEATMTEIDRGCRR